MSTLDGYLKNAKDLATQAIDADEADDIQRAFALYLRAIEWFEMAYRYAPTPRFKDGVKRAMLPYIERAEMIKEALARLKEEGKSAIGGGGDDPGEVDPLKAGISKAILSERPNVRLDDVVGLEAAKEALMQAVVVPLEAPQLIEDGETWRGILLYGPPGTGKSFLAKAIAGETKGTFFSVSASDLISKWVGESERLIKTMFQMARENKPSIIFVDEIESVLSARSTDGDGSSLSANRAVTEFLVQLQGVGSNNDGVLFLGATNLPWMLDTGARRRMERAIYIPLPDERARRLMLFRGVAKRSAALAEDNEFIDELVQMTDGFSGSDIQGLLKDAGLVPLQKVIKAQAFKKNPDEPGTFIPSPIEEGPTIECTFREFKDKRLLRNPPITREDYVNAAERARPTVDREGLGKYDDWTAKFGTQTK